MSATSEDRLTPLYQDLDATVFEDFLSLAASNVESALLENGARPNEDYTHKDLITLAMPLVVEQFKAGKIALRLDVEQE